MVIPFEPMMAEEPRFGLNTHDPSIRKMLISKYDKYGGEYVEKEFNVSASAVRKWKVLLKRTGSLGTRFADCGTHSTLTSKEKRKLFSELEKNPHATNKELAAKIKNKISPRQVGNIIKQADPPFVWKMEQPDLEESFSPGVVEETQRFFRSIKKVDLDSRVYVDETSASPGIPRRMGRYRANKKPYAIRNTKYPRMVIIGAVTRKGWLCPSKILDKGSMSNKDFDDYVIKNLVPQLDATKTVLWDRLGRSGRAANPTSRHFSPKARKAIESTGAQLRLLPPFGKYGDPIEPIFGDTKKFFEKKMRKEFEKSKPSKIPFKRKRQLWLQSEKEVGPKSFIRAFKERANGQEYNRVLREKGLIK